MNLVLFDIDGTLTRTIAADEVCFSRAYEVALGIPGINTDWSAYTHCTDSTISQEIIVRRLGRLPLEGEVSRVQDCYVSQLKSFALEDPMSFQPIPGAVEVLAHLRSAGEWAAAIATGGWGRSARYKLEAAGVEVAGIPFASADDGLTREEILDTAVERARAHYGQERFERIVSVGDGLWDVQCAAHMGMAFIGIGEQTQRERLLLAGARDVLEDYLDLGVFIQLLREAVIPQVCLSGTL